MQTNILIIGGGYVGFYTALKLLNNEKIENIDIYDIDQKKINNWKNRKNVINDNYLDNFLNKNPSIFKKLNYINKINYQKYNYFFISLPTNPLISKKKIIFNKEEKYNLHTDLIFKYSENIKKINPNAEIIIRSTINYNDYKKFDKLKLNYWPEFLSQGKDIEKNLNWNKIIFTKNDNLKEENLKEIFSEKDFRKLHFLPIKESIIIKIFHNSFDAFSITISNLLANIAENKKLNFSNLTPILNELLAVKPRVKNPGIGYGGSCYPKDSRSLFNLTNSKYDLKLLNNLDKYNLKRRKIYKNYLNEIKISKYILILGISFKGQTNDITDTPTKDLIDYFIRKKYNFKIWEPNLNNLNLNKINKKINSNHLSNNIDNDLKECDLIFIGADWEIFNNFLINKKIINKKIIDLKSYLPITNYNTHFKIGDTIN